MNYPPSPQTPIDQTELEDGLVNPFPAPIWLPESAHFVRQWWPTLPIVPRLSCTVILLADHDPVSHRTRYVLAQHYFQVPLTGQLPRMRIPPPNGNGNGTSSSSEDCHDGTWHNDASSTSTSSTLIGDGNDVGDKLEEQEPSEEEEETTIPLWYVSEPFDVVCTLEMLEDVEDNEPLRPRPLVAVDFGHACWIEYEPPTPSDSQEQSQTTGGPRRRLRFVSFPPVTYDNRPDGKETYLEKKSKETEGEVRTLEIPEELDINQAETINIDQSHGAIIISTKDGKVFILCYE